MSTCPSCGVDLNSDNPMNFCRCPKVLQRAKDYAMTDFELTKSIIHECPALRLPQSFIEQLGMVAQIVALKGASPQVAQFIVDSCNAALRASTPAESVPEFDHAALYRAMDLASMLAGSVGMNAVELSRGYANDLRAHLSQFIVTKESSNGM